MAEFVVDGEVFTDDGEVDALYHAAAPVLESIPEFASVTGICRTCKNAFIFEREYGDEVNVKCDAIHPPLSMPLDIRRCSRYERRGEVSLERMKELAQTIDTRQFQGGQYL